jgi:hypothetical protein
MGHLESLAGNAARFERAEVVRRLLVRQKPG